MHSEDSLHAGGFWRLVGDGVVAEGAIEPTTVEPLRPTEVGAVFVEVKEPGPYTLHVEFGSLRREWSILAVAKHEAEGVVCVSEACRAVAENSVGISVVGMDDFLIGAGMHRRSLY